MKNKNLPLFETAFILLGELVVSLIVCLIYFAIGKFSYKVILGASLGTAVTVLNFLFLAITTSRAFDKALDARGTREMDDEDAEKFASEHQASIQNAVKLSFIVRTFTMLAALVAAFLIKQFDVIATLVPLLMLRPIISLEAILRQKRGGGE